MGKNAGWTKRLIKAGLAKDDRWVEKAIRTLYACQTADEKRTGSAKWRNGRGFNSHDAKWFSKLAKYLQGGAHLTPNQMAEARNRLMKYAGQLAKIANAKELAKAGRRKRA